MDVPPEITCANVGHYWGQAYRTPIYETLKVGAFQSATPEEICAPAKLPVMRERHCRRCGEVERVREHV